MLVPGLLQVIVTSPHCDRLSPPSPALQAPPTTTSHVRGKPGLAACFALHAWPVGYRPEPCPAIRTQPWQHCPRRCMHGSLHARFPSSPAAPPTAPAQTSPLLPPLAATWSCTSPQWSACRSITRSGGWS